LSVFLGSMGRIHRFNYRRRGFRIILGPSTTNSSGSRSEWECQSSRSFERGRIGPFGFDQRWCTCV